MSRATWDEYFIGLAQQAAARSTCPRLRVGAVLVADKRIISTGYNGAVRGLPHCDDSGCQMEDGHCVRTVHAEVNTLLGAGPKANAATLYVTASPCWGCFKAIANARIARVVYAKFYADQRSLDTAALCGIELVAHGIGHLIKHEPGRTFRENWDVPVGLDICEIQANLFAADLLMPTWMLTAFMSGKTVRQLAEIFTVSSDAMMHRLRYMKVID